MNDYKFDNFSPHSTCYNTNKESKNPTIEDRLSYDEYIVYRTTPSKKDLLTHSNDIGPWDSQNIIQPHEYDQLVKKQTNSLKSVNNSFNTSKVSFIKEKPNIPSNRFESHPMKYRVNSPDHLKVSSKNRFRLLSSQLHDSLLMSSKDKLPHIPNITIPDDIIAKRFNNINNASMYNGVNNLVPMKKIQINLHHVLLDRLTKFSEYPSNNEDQSGLLCQQQIPKRKSIQAKKRDEYIKYKENNNITQSSSNSSKFIDDHILGKSNLSTARKTTHIEYDQSNKLKSTEYDDSKFLLDLNDKCDIYKDKTTRNNTILNTKEPEIPIPHLYEGNNHNIQAKLAEVNYNIAKPSRNIRKMELDSLPLLDQLKCNMLAAARRAKNHDRQMKNIKIRPKLNILPKSDPANGVCNQSANYCTNQLRTSQEDGTSNAGSFKISRTKIKKNPSFLLGTTMNGDDDETRAKRQDYNSEKFKEDDSIITTQDNHISLKTEATFKLNNNSTEETTNQKIEQRKQISINQARLQNEIEALLQNKISNYCLKPPKHITNKLRISIQGDKVMKYKVGMNSITDRIKSILPSNLLAPQSTSIDFDKVGKSDKENEQWASQNLLNEIMKKDNNYDELEENDKQNSNFEGKLVKNQLKKVLNTDIRNKHQAKKVHKNEYEINKYIR